MKPEWDATYPVEWLESGQEHIDWDHNYLSEVQKDFPVESIVIQACI